MLNSQEVDFLPLVSIVILNHNGGEMLLSCIRSVFTTDYPSMDVILVDNASSDGSPQEALSEFPDLRLIELERNVGYAVGNNLGIKASKGDYVALLNNDTLVERGWLKAMVSVGVERPDVAFIQPKILMMDDPEVINSAGNFIHIAGFGVCRGIGQFDKHQFETVDEVCYASGACLLASRRAIEKLGLLDEIFSSYGEDKDWGWRARMHGYKSLYVPSAVILHKWSRVLGKSKEKYYLLERERLISLFKNYSRRTLALLSPVLLLIEVGVLIYAATTGWIDRKIASYSELLSIREELKKHRKALEHSRSRPDSHVTSLFTGEISHPYIFHFVAPLNVLVSRISKLILSTL